MSDNNISKYMLTGNLYAILVITLQASIHALNFNMNSLDTNHNCSYYKFCGCLNYLQKQKRDSPYSCHWFLWSLRAIHLSCVRNFLSYWAVYFCIDIVTLKSEQSSEISLVLTTTPGSDTLHPAKPHYINLCSSYSSEMVLYLNTSLQLR